MSLVYIYCQWHNRTHGHYLPFDQSFSTRTSRGDCSFDIIDFFRGLTFQGTVLSLSHGPMGRTSYPAPDGFLPGAS